MGNTEAVISDDHDANMLARFEDLHIDKTNTRQSKVIKYIGTSKVEREWIRLCEKQMGIPKGCIICADEEGKGQKWIIGPNKRRIYFDGYCPDRNIVFEFHGCKWHSCRICFPNSDIELYNKTIEREKYILHKGYRLFRTWEHEYKDYLNGINLSYGAFVTYPS